MSGGTDRSTVARCGSLPPQGKASLEVDVSCNRPVDEIDLVLPGLTIDEMQPSKGDTATLHGVVVKLLGNGTKGAGIVFQTTPDPAAGDMLKDVVEITGDSYDYFAETM